MIIPWRVFNLIDERWPRIAHVLRFGTANINTAEHWDKAWGRHGANGFRATAHLEQVRRRILEEISPGAHVLDVGCGAGELLVELQTLKNCRCAGVDISAVAVEAVRSKGLEARVATLPEVPYERDRFDVAVCTETLEHVTDVPGSLRAIARVIRPGGRFLMSVPDGAVDRESAHVHRFTREGLEALLRRHFCVESIELVCEPNAQSLLAIASKPSQTRD